MVISQPPGIILHIIIVNYTNAASIALVFQKTPYILYMQLQHQGNS